MTDMTNATAVSIAGDGNTDASDEMAHDFATHISAIANTIEHALTIGQEGVIDGYESEYLVEYPTSRFLGTMCWSSKKRVEETLTSLARMAGQLEGMVRRNRGSEVESKKIEDHISRIQDREHQLDVAIAMRDASDDVYLAMTGQNYGPADTINKAATTAASIQAKAILAKYGASETPAADTKDERQTNYTGGDTDYVLGADGKYYQVA